MKTPMQELIEHIRQLLPKHGHVLTSSQVLTSVMSNQVLTSVMSKAESLLEKEKEVIINAVTQGWDYNEQGLVRWLGEKHYNQTFKTKER